MGSGSGSGTLFTHVNDSRGTVHRLAIKDDDDNHSYVLHEADDELSDDDLGNEHPQVRVDAAAPAAQNTADEDNDGHEHDLTQDSKDVLVERLADLIHHLQEAKEQTTTQSVLSDVSISELHAKVDEMEAVITGKGDRTRTRRTSRRESRQGQDESGGESVRRDGDDDQTQSPLKDRVPPFASSAVTGAAAAPGWLSRNFSGSGSGSEPSPPESRAHSPSSSSRIQLKNLAEAAEIKPSDGMAGMAPPPVASTVEAEMETEPSKKRQDAIETQRIATEADKLASQLEAVLKSLETRREESNVSFPFHPSIPLIHQTSHHIPVVNKC